MNQHVYQLAVADEDTFFAATQAGLQCSRNGGQSWESAYQALNPPEPIPTFALLVSPNFAQNGLLFAGIPGGIVRSNDRGHTWRILLLPEPAPVVSALAFAQDGVLLVGTVEDGIFRSRNGGETWESWNFGLLDANINCLYVSSDDGKVYAGTESGLFVSENNGRSWQPLSFPMAAAPVISLAQMDSQDLLVGTEENGLYISQQSSERWEQLCFSNDTVEAILCDKDRVHIICNQTSMIFQPKQDKLQRFPQAERLITALAVTQSKSLLLGCADGQVLIVDNI